MAERIFSPGFRLSILDIAVLVLGGAASAYSVSIDVWFGIAIAFVVLHFLLFCNVLRMSRPLELIWAGIFASLAVAAMSSGVLGWPVVFAASTFVTIVVVVIETRKPSYHGAGWRKLNPRLPEWWQANSSSI